MVKSCVVSINEHQNGSYFSCCVKRQKSRQKKMKLASKNAEKFADSKYIYNSISQKMSLKALCLGTVDIYS